MRLDELKTGDSVFIDANIFLYHFAGVSKECKEFLKRCEDKDLFGVTGVTILAEVCHQLMIAEAIARKFIRPAKPVLSLQKNPHIIKKLSEYSAQIVNITGWGIKVLGTPDDILIRSQVYRTQFGLLTNDSFIPVYMRLAGTDRLATNDQLFNRIPSLRIYFSSDI